MQANPCARCCQDLNINPLHLLCPELMDSEGQMFVEAHGLELSTLQELMNEAQVLPNGFVELQHRCAQLSPEGLCTIYDIRPEICRAYKCESRMDCVNRSAA